MARKRMIDPEFFLDEGLAELSPLARLLYIGVWGICDDNYATFPNRDKWIKAQVFPYDSVNTRKLLDELESSGHIIKFVADNNEEYYYVKNFFKYQRVDRPSAPKYPQFNEKTRVLDESSTSPRPEVKLSKVKLKEEKGTSTQEYLTTFPIEDFSDIDATEKQIRLEAEKANNWLLSKGTTRKDYKAFLRNWVLKVYKKRVASQPTVEFEINPEGIARIKDMKAKFNLN